MFCEEILTKIFYLLGIFSIFQGMAVPGLQEFGVSPFFLIQLVFVFFAMRFCLVEGFSVPGKWYKFYLAFTIFVLYSLASAFVLPTIFDGIRVYTPKGGIDQQYLAPGILHPSGSNYAQALFLILYWILIAFLLFRRDKKIFPVIERSYFVSGLAVCFFSYYQLVSIVFGIYYPTSILLSNERFALGEDSSFLFLPRINATFSEPSFYGMFMASFVAWVYIRYVNELNPQKAKQWLILLGISLFSLILSTSSTGYLAAVTFFALHTLNAMVRGQKSKSRNKILLILFGSASLLVLAYLFVDGVDTIANAIVFDKGSSDSAKHRLESDRYAFVILENTYYLGAGLGSTRPSSFITFLISNVGVIGFVLALLSGYYLWQRGLAASRNTGDFKKSVSIQASGWALFTMLIAKAFAGSELNFPPMWVLIAYYLVATLSAERNEPTPDSVSHRSNLVGRA